MKDGRIIALGPDAALTRMAQGAEVVNLQGAVVMPGLIDCHNHFLSTALGWERVQLAETTSIGELLEAIGQRVKETPPGQWVLCASRWHETNLAERRMPTAEELDRRVNTHSRTHDRGHTLEHAFSPVPGAMEHTRDLGLGVTLQHSLVYSLAGNMQSYWGQQRAADCTPSRAWLDSGVVVGAGTDSPVAHYDPWLNIYGFATRDTQVAGVLGPQHRIAVGEALHAYTVGSAHILGWNNSLGMLVPGQAADFICLDRDPLAIPVDQVRHVRVTRTVVHGRQVFHMTTGSV